MNREFLKGLGLEDEAVNKVMAEYGKSVNELKEQANEVDTLKAQVEDYKEQLTARDDQLEELKKVDAEGLQAKIDELQTANETTKTEYEEKLQQQRKDLTISNAIKLALANNVHDVDVAATLIDKEKLVIGDNGAVVGLDEQIAALKESKSYLFVQDPKPTGGPRIFAGGNPSGGGTGPVTKEQIMQEKDDAKRQQLIKQNSHLFK